MINITYGVGHASDPKTQTVQIACNFYSSNLITEDTVVEHTDNTLRVRCRKIELGPGQSVKHKEMGMLFTIKRGKMKEQISTFRDIKKADDPDWWGFKIQQPLDFDQHPGNKDIHDKLIGREPRYLSERVLITKSGFESLYVSDLGWCYAELVFEGEVDQSVFDELQMARGIINLSK